MKFAYVDESGDSSQSDVFVMAAVLIDGVKLRKYTIEFDALLKDFLARHPKAPKELKTKALIQDSDKWSKVPADERKEFITQLIDLAVGCSRIFAYAISFKAFQAETADRDPPCPFAKSYWVSAAMYVTALIQKKNQKEPKNKGQTVLIFDNNDVGMPALSASLYEPNVWYDALYQGTQTKKGKQHWVARKPVDRFDQIINTAFAVRSEHASLVQVADAVSYVYRRHLELTSAAQGWPGEQAYFEGLVGKLEARRERIGRTPDTEATKVYASIRHAEWAA